ncbi:MAG: citrate synthase [Candidatus Krumholzibacteriia bacterium]
MTEYVPGLAGVPAARSSISFIDGEQGILEYRGIRIETLAQHSTFEETAYLLLHGKLPGRDALRRFSETLGEARRLPPALEGLIRSFPKGARPMEVLQACAAALGTFLPEADYGRADAREWAAVEIIAKIPSIAAAFERYRRGEDAIEPDPGLGHAVDFVRMITGSEPDGQRARVMDVALILHADHTMNASTFAARVTASTNGSPFAVVSSAIGCLAGSLHGGANERVLIQLREIGAVDRVEEAVRSMVLKREKIMGLGHRVYKTKDPRAIILQGLATELFETTGKSDVYDLAVALENVAGELLGHKGIYPNVDFYSGIVYDKLGVPRDLFTPVFAVSRAAGWMAHWLEQMRDNRLFRPRQIYEGSRDVTYVPLAER